MHDGKADLLEYLDVIHPNQEILIDDLAPGRANSLPNGFSITDNPQSLSIISPDPNRTMLFGPVSDSGVTIRVSEKASGAFVKGIDLIVAIARLVEVGPPTYQKSLELLAKWWRAQISECSPFLVAEAPPRTRTEMELHIEACGVCQPISQAMAASISAGSTAYRDEDVRSMIERAHNDPVAAIAHYEQKRAAHAMKSTNHSKPSRRKTEVEVPA